MEKLNPMMRPSNVRLAARITPKSARRSSGTSKPNLPRKNAPIHVANQSTTNETTKTRDGRLSRSVTMLQLLPRWAASVQKNGDSKRRGMQAAKVEHHLPMGERSVPNTTLPRQQSSFPVQNRGILLATGS